MLKIDRYDSNTNIVSLLVSPQFLYIPSEWMVPKVQTQDYRGMLQADLIDEVWSLGHSGSGRGIWPIVLVELSSYAPVCFIFIDVV